MLIGVLTCGSREDDPEDWCLGRLFGGPCGDWPGVWIIPCPLGAGAYRKLELGAEVRGKSLGKGADIPRPWVGIESLMLYWYSWW